LGTITVTNFGDRGVDAVHGIIQPPQVGLVGLVEHKGFTVIAVEGDWPDAARIDAHVRGRPSPSTEPFARFPTWMWRNEAVRDHVRWLNDTTPQWRTRPVGSASTGSTSTACSSRATPCRTLPWWSTPSGLQVVRSARGPGTKVVVWEHNSHVGDASATEMGHRGDLPA